MEETTKPCSECGLDLSLDCYYERDRKISSCVRCKKCKNKANKESYNKHKEKRLAKNKEYVELNLDKVKEYKNKWYLENKEKTIERVNNWVSNNREKHRAFCRKSNSNNRERINNYIRNKYATDQNFKIRMSITRRILSALKSQNCKKDNIAANYLGCSIEELRKYLESKFLPGMSWQNYGRNKENWQIDHIIPCANFDLTRIEEQYKCFHYSNLQPLWAPENWFKNRFLIEKS